MTSPSDETEMAFPLSDGIKRDTFTLVVHGDAGEMPMQVDRLESNVLPNTMSAPLGGDASIVKFARLRDEWRRQRRHEPSTFKSVMLPAYQSIIGMGPAAVPLLLRELESNLDNWFWALKAITEADPVPESIRGDGAAMAQAWLAWAKEHGYRW